MDTPARTPLRLWPGVAIVILEMLIRFGLPVVMPGSMMYAVIGGVAGGALVALWWLLFSRARWFDRVGAIVLMAGALFATSRLVDKSIATGAQGMLLYLLAIPALSLAFVAALVVTRKRVVVAAAILLACGAWTCVRTGGMSMSFHNDLRWRWAADPEERLIAKAPIPAPPAPVQRPVAPVVPAPKKVPEPPAIWPGFRGPRRDDRIPGVRIKTDWTASPPVAMWRRPVGPGWSSFSVSGNLIYTQEQRGPAEIVACYRLSTGEPVWAHTDTARFWESNGGAGPRATPTLSNGRVYTFGATGMLNALDAHDGSLVWSHNAASDTGTKVPTWGFASSPLVIDDLVIVAPAGRLVAYDIETGKRRWSGPVHGASYSSPHLAKIDGVAQILLLSDFGASSVALADGALLWEHAWKGYPIVQPALTSDGDVLIAVSDKSGTRRLHVNRGPAGWSAEERWTSNGLKPYFNDFVVDREFAFGFDGSVLSCIDLKDGARKWKGGRYGNGQLVLLADQDLLLVVSEEGEVALVGATPDQFAELARFQAVEGKTWNHPVVAGDVLLVRNGQEMAAFRLRLTRD